ncbi:hypothetical protein [Phnomibacter sp. MR]|uniref:hypothetical protein n=1 Tax=Phnomibacter sp. MR TaxID=3042318 RepID=UPI003A80B2C4
MKDLLIQLIAVLNLGEYSFISELNPPISISDDRLEKYFIERYDWCPAEIKVLYKWHDGQAFPVPVKQFDFLFDHALFLPFEQAKLYSEIDESDDSYYRDYFTLFTSGGGEDYLIKMRGEEKGAIFYLSPSKFMGEPVKAFDSLEKLFSSVIECYKSGVYWEENGQFRKSVRLQMTKMAELNPGCIRWTDRGPL